MAVATAVAAAGVAVSLGTMGMSIGQAAKQKN